MTAALIRHNANKEHAGEAVNLQENLKLPEEHIKSLFICELYDIAKAIPPSVPEATKEAMLSKFLNLSQLDNLAISTADLWKEILNPFLKEVLGWGTNMDLESIIQRGKLGFEVVAAFVGHFVDGQGVDEVLFEGKLVHLVQCAKKVTSVFTQAPILNDLTHLFNHTL